MGRSTSYVGRFFLGLTDYRQLTDDFFNFSRSVMWPKIMSLIVYVYTCSVGFCGNQI